MRFDVLIGAHRPGDPAEATLVLLAVAALNGLKGDGTPMPGAKPARSISISRIADEAGICRRAARRGLDYMAAAGAVVPVLDERGEPHFVAEPQVLATRWAQSRQRIRLPAAVRQLRLRPKEALLVGLVEWQRPQDGGPLRLGRQYLSDRLGFSLRQVDRATAGAKKAGVLRTWTHNGILHLLPVLPKEATATATNPSRGTIGTTMDLCRSGNPPCAKAAKGTGPKRQSACAEAANAIRSTGVQPDQHPDPASPVAETLVQVGSGQGRPPSVSDVRAVIEPWVVSMVERGITRLDAGDPNHCIEVAVLIEKLPGCAAPDFGTGLSRRRGYYREQRRLAARLCRWAGSPEELARWLVRVASKRSVVNLAGYLRVAAQKGDPGTLLRSAKKNEAGRAAESWQDFSPHTEKALEGDRLADVQRLVAAGAMVLAATDPAERAALKDALRDLLASGRTGPARAVLMRLVGPEPSDAALAANVGDILSVTEARRLLVA